MERNIIYDSQREQALNFYAALLTLDEEGKDVGELIEETWQKIKGYAEEDDEERLLRLREELKKVVHDKIVMEEWTKNQHEP